MLSIKFCLEAGRHKNKGASVNPICPFVCTWSMVLEVVLESLRQRECVDVMDALSTQSQSSYSSAQVHQGEGLRCEGQGRQETWSVSKQSTS